MNLYNNDPIKNGLEENREEAITEYGNINELNDKLYENASTLDERVEKVKNAADRVGNLIDFIVTTALNLFVLVMIVSACIGISYTVITEINKIKDDVQIIKEL